MALGARLAPSMLVALLTTTASHAAEVTEAASPPPPSPGGLAIVGGVLLQAGGMALLVWGVSESFRGLGQSLSCALGCSAERLAAIERPSPLAEPMAVVGVVSGLAGFGLMIYGIARVVSDASAPPGPVTVSAGPSSVALSVTF